MRRRRPNLNEHSASAKVAMRDEVCRRRKWLRFAWTRNQNWIEVAEAAAARTPSNVASAEVGATAASEMMKGRPRRDLAAKRPAALVLSS